MQAHSARRKSHSCRVWRRKLSRSEPVSKFRAQFSSLVSFACCKTIIRETTRIHVGFFHFFEILGVSNCTSCKRYDTLRHTFSDLPRRMSLPELTVYLYHLSDCVALLITTCPIYGTLSKVSRLYTVLPFSKLNKTFFGYFDPGNIFLDNKNR